MFGKVFCEILYNGKKMSKELITNLVFFVIYCGMTIGFNITSGVSIIYPLPWIGFYFLLFMWMWDWQGEKGFYSALMGSDLPTVLYYVPHKRSGIRGYLVTRIWVMTVSYGMLAVIILGFIIGISCLGNEEKPEFVLKPENLLTVIAFLTLILRMQIAGISRLMVGESFLTESRLLRFFHNIMIIMNVICLFFSNGDIMMYGNTFDGLGLDQWIVLVMTIVGVLHIIWYFRYTLRILTGDRKEPGGDVQ